MASALKSLSDIPSVSVLYRTKKLRPSSDDDLVSPSQQLNDKVCTLKYDLTKLQVDAIVNAANRSLLGGGGVDGAIHNAAGPGLFDECRTLGGCDTGSAKITDAYDLPCKKVIHAVGPVYHNAAESEPLLRGCYRTALQLAVENNCRSIAFSAISTGIYGYPSDAAATSAVREVMKFLKQPEGQKLDKVIFCNFLEKDVNAYARVLPVVFPPTQEDLTPSGEYPLNEDALGDNLPTPFQTRPRAVFEVPPSEIVAASMRVTNEQRKMQDVKYSATNHHANRSPATTPAQFETETNNTCEDEIAEMDRIKDEDDNSLGKILLTTAESHEEQASHEDASGATHDNQATAEAEEGMANPNHGWFISLTAAPVSRASKVPCESQKHSFEKDDGG